MEVRMVMYQLSRREVCQHVRMYKRIWVKQQDTTEHHSMVKADLTGFMEDFSRLLLNSFPAALKFVLGVLELHYPDFPILDGLL